MTYGEYINARLEQFDKAGDAYEVSVNRSHYKPVVTHTKDFLVLFNEIGVHEYINTALVSSISIKEC